MSKLRTLMLGAALVLGVSAGAQAATPNIQQVHTPGGFKALLVSTPTPRIVDVRITYTCGSIFDPVGKEGLANLTSTLFNESVNGMDTITFTRKMEDLGASIGGNASAETLSVSLRALSPNLEGSFALFAQSVLAPDFTEGDTERMKQQIVAGLQDDATDPGKIASEAYARHTYGAHPRSRPHDGTLATVPTLTHTDVRAFYATCATRSNAVISAVGDVSAEELTRLLDTYLADLPVGDGRNEVPVVTADANPSLIRIEVPVPQSTLMMGHLIDTLPRDHEDFWPLHVANYILGGGGFESRLTDEVREKRGLAYGIGSNIWSIKQRGMFLAQTAVNNAVVDQVAGIIRDEVTKLHTHGVTAEELKDAKAFLSGEFPIRLGSNSTIMTYIELIQLEGLPLDYMDTRVGNIMAVTEADILRAVKRHLRPDNLTVVVVGGPAQ